MFSPTLEPLNCSVSVPDPPSTTSLPSPGFQMNEIVAGTAEYRVVAAATRENVIAGAPDQQIIAIATEQHVVAATAIDGVVAGAAVDGVGGVRRPCPAGGCHGRRDKGRYDDFVGAGSGKFGHGADPHKCVARKGVNMRMSAMAANARHEHRAIG